MKLSIIVPVYKVEQYLDKCIESILAQTFTEYELILVDDGSPDNCGKMCDEWAGKDQRIRVIHKENGGLSDARNAGLDAAQGEYIGFVDSDDYVHPELFERLLRNADLHQADISMCGYVNVYPSGERQRNTDEAVLVWTQEEAIYHILKGKEVSVHAYTKLYRRELFNGVRYQKGVISEDAYIIMDIMDKVRVAVFTPMSLYYYVHRANSINTSAYEKKDLTRIEAHHKNYLYIKEKYPAFEKLAYDRYLAANAYVADKSIMSKTGLKTPEVKACIGILRDNYGKVLSSDYFRARRKILIGIMLVSKGLYRTIIRLFSYR
ncbi:MAG: glycosyltransferase [Lachnospiraceae bacterium]|nr:glycosyltransferase [Lachnospiraceae bacterium]